MTIEPQYGNRIRSVRKAHDLTQQELSNMAGIAVNSLRRYESNERCPSIDVLEKIASVLGMTLGEFLWDPDDDPAPAKYFWTADLEDKMKMIGYSIGYDEDNASIWIVYPDKSTLEVSEEDLKTLHSASNAFLRFQIEELKNPKKP